MGFTDGVRAIKQKIVNALRTTVGRVFVRARPRIEKRIIAVSPELFKETDTYISLVDGELNHQFGFYAGTADQKVDTVLEAVAKIIKVRITTPIVKNERLEGTIEVFLDPDELSIIYGMSEANIETEYGYVLPWFKWLIEEGTGTIVANFQYLAIPAARSRSGLGIMVQSKRGKNYSVPVNHAGTPDDNWITRSLFDDRLLKEYSKIIKQEVERA